MGEAQQKRNQGTRALAVQIALRGGRIGKSSFVADWSPYCDDPVTIKRLVTSRQAVRLATIGGLTIRDEVTAMEVAADVPCRRCAKCLQFRQMMWRERAIIEIDQSHATGHRTWWLTLTFSEIHLAGIIMEAMARDKEVEWAAYRHVQRYLKRLRKLRCQFRYLAIYELGKKTGRSHYHLFLHEVGTKPIVKAQLESQWRSNVHARLVSSGDARRRASYVTEYATKSFSIRPRASSLYGKLIIPSKTLVLRGQFSKKFGKQ